MGDFVAGEGFRFEVLFRFPNIDRPKALYRTNGEHVAALPPRVAQGVSVPEIQAIYGNVPAALAGLAGNFPSEDSPRTFKLNLLRRDIPGI